MLSSLPFKNTVLLSMAAFAFACGDNGNGAKSPDAKTTGNPDSSLLPPDAAKADAAPPADVSMVTTQAAAAVCKTLFRCCDDDLNVYFDGYKRNTRLAAFVPRLPPANEADCSMVLKEMMDIVPFGDWLAAVQNNGVAFDPAALTSCIADLNNSTCGESARAALFDSTCFALSPPGGGAEQRKIFKRTQEVGAACVAIRDGFGGGIFGSCNPETSFCCAPEVAPRTGCRLAIDGQGVARPATCQAVAEIGATCSPFNPILPCATGDVCSEGDLCIPEVVPTPVQVGDVCASGDILTGDCANSWCDITGTKLCTALKANGITCTGGFECETQACLLVDPAMPSGPRQCGPNNLCTGPI
jgi:hypothetical protein